MITDATVILRNKQYGLQFETQRALELPGEPKPVRSPGFDIKPAPSSLPTRNSCGRNECEEPMLSPHETSVEWQ
jgi:hypothetical protein